VINITLLEINDLWVKIPDQKEYLLRNIDLRINDGEVHVLMGPNGSGKSTLLKTIMGIPPYEVVRGSIKFMGKDITKLKPYERAKMGIGLAFQSPPRIYVKANYIVELMTRKFRTQRIPYSRFGIQHLIERNLYEGFSGGEIKRMELYITLIQRPKLALLDEPDSGVDVDSLSIIAEGIKELIENRSAVLLVTHLGYILKFIGLEVVNRLHVMIDGTIVYSGNAEKALEIILSEGYDAFREGI